MFIRLLHVRNAGTRMVVDATPARMLAGGAGLPPRDLTYVGGDGKGKREREMFIEEGNRTGNETPPAKTTPHFAFLDRHTLTSRCDDVRGGAMHDYTSEIRNRGVAGPCQ